MFGVTDGGNSILVHIDGFLSFFYMQAPYDLNLND